MKPARTRTSFVSRWTLLLSLILLIGVSCPVAAAADDFWQLHLKAQNYKDSGYTYLAVPIWQELMRRAADRADWETAAIYAGNLDQYFDAVKDYDQAVVYYELENEYWLKAGKDWGAVDLERANQLRTTVELYASAGEDEDLLRSYMPRVGGLAKFEPEYGLYIGIYSERDKQMGNAFKKSEALYGKKHAIYLAYATYGDPFPARYAANAKEAGGALQIAWQPLNGLGSVKDDEYLRKWAKQANAAGIPIFLRFAGEMNGNWTAWGGDSAAYIEKFRIVANVMKEEAPNVAMVWSPGDVPRYSMSKYYPGDEYVDWVGVSLYTEPYSHGDPGQSMLATTPIERLEEIYRLYADRKPVMLSESAVSHLTHADGKSHTEYALLNLERLYKVMPLKYPRLKAITYFNVDMGGEASRNDYMLRNNPDVLALYKQLIADPYYLTEVKTGAKPSNRTVYRGPAEPFAKRTTLIPFVRIPDVFIGKLEYALNGVVLAEQTRPPFGLSLDAGDVPEGSILELRVYNREGRKAAARSFPLSSRVSVDIDGIDQTFEQPPVIVEGNTLAPLRAIFERMGATVTWDPATRTATGRKDGTTVSLAIGERAARVNGRTVELEQPAQLVNGYTLAPARFVGEAFGGTVTWDGRTRTVHISTRK